MSSIKDEIIITFEELKHLQVDDIAACVDKCQALIICEKSSAPAEEIYNIWVHKLFKGYDVSQFEEEDWLQIFDYLERVLEKFIDEVSALLNDSKLQKFNSWWLDTLELLIWLESVIVHMDVRILALVLNFILEVVIKSCNKTDKRNIEPIAAIQKKLLHFLTTHMINMNMRNTQEFNGVNKVLSSLCDVGSTVSSANIKLSIETWRVVATITTKCNGYYKSMDIEQQDSFNDKKIDYTSKPIIGILNDLKKLFKYLDEDSAALNNEKFLKVGQFLLKLLKIIMQNSVLPFPGVKEFFELYALCMHQLKKKNAKRVTEYIQNDLKSILQAIFKQQGVVENICLHLRNDNKSFETCDLALEYMQLYLGNDEKQTADVARTIQIFDLLFADPLYFIDKDKYPKVVLYFVNLTAEDATGDLHIKWCNKVVDQPWIKAFTSCEILGLYYRNLSKCRPEQMISCLEYWINCWQQFYVTSSSRSVCHQQYLIERILKILVTCAQLPHNKIEHIFHKYPNSKILLLKCGHANGQLFSYFNTNIRNYLQQLQDFNIKRKGYTDLLNLMEIMCRDPRLLKIFTGHEDLVKAFLKLFLLSATDMQKFKGFFNKSFYIFTLMKHDDKAILRNLKINLDKTKSIAGIFLLGYLFKIKPSSDNLLECLQTTELMENQNFLLNEENNAMDLKLLRDLYSKSINCNTNDVVTHASKRPRLVHDDCNSSNYKSIINEMLELSRQLLNCPVDFDFKDLELMESIENNLLKCSQK